MSLLYLLSPAGHQQSVLIIGRRVPAHIDSSISIYWEDIQIVSMILTSENGQKCYHLSI